MGGNHCQKLCLHREAALCYSSSVLLHFALLLGYPKTVIVLQKVQIEATRQRMKYLLENGASFGIAFEKFLQLVNQV